MAAGESEMVARTSTGGGSRRRGALLRAVLLTVSYLVAYFCLSQLVGLILGHRVEPARLPP